jgi:hypothetical protein
MLVKKYRPNLEYRLTKRLAEDLSKEINKRILQKLKYATKKVWK